MTEVVVDASVAIKWFVAEPDSNLAEKLLEHQGRLVYLALARRLSTPCVTADRPLLRVAPAGLTIALADWKP